MAAVETRLEVPADHPAYEGHFPGRPILPGVMLLAEALAVIESATGKGACSWSIANAKFVSPVSPGTPLTMSHEALASGEVRFEVRTGATVVLHGTLRAVEET